MRVASDPRIDVLRGKMVVSENTTFTEEYYAPDKRAIGNAVQVFFKDGTRTERVQVDYPLGHRKRRAEGMPVLVQKFEASVTAHFHAEAGRGDQGDVCGSGEVGEDVGAGVCGGVGEEQVNLIARAMAHGAPSARRSNQ